MPKFMCSHTLEPNSVTRRDAEQIAQASQQDPLVRGYRSFLNLSEGKVMCIVEAPDRSSVASWFDKMGLPYDSIQPVELEGERGHISDLRTQIPQTSSAATHLRGA